MWSWGFALCSVGLVIWVAVELKAHSPPEGSVE